MIVLHRLSGPKSVTELAGLLNFSLERASVLLTPLRFAGVIFGQRDGKSIYYSLSDTQAAKLVTEVFDVFSSGIPYSLDAQGRNPFSHTGDRSSTLASL